LRWKDLKAARLGAKHAQATQPSGFKAFAITLVAVSALFSGYYSNAML
jgi:hypothetical protein